MSRRPNKFVHIISLGCPKNFVDTEVMAGTLLQNNIGITPYEDDANIKLVNTCAFIPDARSEASDVIEECIEWKKEKPNSRRIVVTGCLNQWDIDGIYRKKLPEVDMWLGTDETANVANHITKVSADIPESKLIGAKRSTYLYNEDTPRLQLTLPHYAYIKIAEGCDHNCSFCSIPRIRGKLRSRLIPSVMKEARLLVERGVKELIVVAQDTTFYGDDLDDPNVTLANLIRKMVTIEGDFWIRIMYTHPASFPDDLIELYRNEPKVIPYLDMPLQHINNEILSCMRRKISSDDTKALIHKIREQVPNMCFRTTFIIGYPGETEEQFQELYDLCKEFKFDRMGAFTYATEPYTRAGKLDEKIEPAVANERRDRLMIMQQDISLKMNEAKIGTEIDVLIDLITEDGTGIGRSYMDAPEIDNAVIVRNDGSLKAGDRVMVKVTDCSEYDLEGVVV